jgi:hypothetical protein
VKDVVMMNEFGRRVYREGRLGVGWSGFLLGCRVRAREDRQSQETEK